MEKNSGPPPYGPFPQYRNGESLPSAPPTYAQAMGGVPPSSPYVPNHAFVHKGPEIVTTVVPIGPSSAHMICQHCQAEIDTTTKTKPGLIAYVSGAILCMIGCCFGCCLIPCCIDKCMNVTHTCPNCGAYLGKYVR